jgi:hypothetical protein
LTSPFFDLPDLRQSDATLLGQRSGLSAADLFRSSLVSVLSVPETRARLTHAYTLRTSKNQIIGGVFRTVVRQARRVDFKYEIDVNGHGKPTDVVPEEMTAQTLSITRWDLYTSLMEEALGTDEIIVLTDQRRGLRLREQWLAPTSILNSRGRRYQYGPCFFTDLGRELGAEGPRTVSVNAELVWLDRKKIV